MLLLRSVNKEIGENSGKAETSGRVDHRQILLLQTDSSALPDRHQGVWYQSQTFNRMSKHGFIYHI